MTRILFALLLGATVAHAADQTILGTEFVVKDPGSAVKRKVTGKAKEKASSNTLVGDPTVDGATLTVRADGATSTEQTFALPQGTNAKGKPFWTGSATSGFKYKDSKGENGAVAQAAIKKSKKGVFTIAFNANGKNGTASGGPGPNDVSVVPPNPGDSGCVLLQLTGGDSYSVRFGPDDGKITNKDGLFKVSKPAEEGTCLTTTTSTIASTTTTIETTSTTASTVVTTTITTTTSLETSTSTSTSSTTSTTGTTIFAGPAFPPVGGDVQFSFAGSGPNPGGADLSLFNFSPTTWTKLYWGPDSRFLPAAGLDGSGHPLSTFAGITGGGTIATWQGVTNWTDPSDNTPYSNVPIQMTITVTAGGVTWVASTSVPDLDPGPASGVNAVIDVAPSGTALDFTVKIEFTADIPTDASGFIPLSTVPQTGGGLLVSSFSGGFYSQP